MVKDKRVQIKQKMGSKLRKLRNERRLTLNQTASLLEVTPGYLGLIERGQRGISMELLLNICRVFEISADFLLGTRQYIETGQSPAHRAAISCLAAMDSEHLTLALGSLKLIHAFQQQNKGEREK